MEAGKFRDDSLARKHTVGELIDRYIVEVIPLKRAGKVQVHQLAEWKMVLGHLRLSQLTPDQILNARSKIAERAEPGKVRSHSTLNRYQAALSHALSYAKKQYGWIERNPIRRVPKLKEPQGRDRFLSDDERNALLAACRASTSKFLLPIVVLAITTGARRGEIETLTWGKVDWERNWITIEDTKNGQRRSVALVEAAKTVLYQIRPERPAPKDYVFPGRKRDRPAVIKKAWYAAVEEAGLENFKFHDLRHTAASYLAMDGASLPGIAAILGHKTHQMANRYAHLSDGHIRSRQIGTMNKVFSDGK